MLPPSEIEMGETTRGIIEAVNRGAPLRMLLLDDRTSEGQDFQLHSIAHGVVALYSNTPAGAAGVRCTRDQAG